MGESVLIFKNFSYILYFIYTVFSVLSGYLVYSGLTSKVERAQTRLRVKSSLQENKKKIVEKAEGTGAESLLKKAGYPIGLNGVKYYAIFIGLTVFLAVYYLVFPSLNGEPISIWKTVVLIGVYLLLLPSFPYSLFKFIVTRVIDYKQAKKNSEIFMLYDLLINEIEMMKNTRINTYNLLRNMRPLLDVLNSPMSRLLSTWSNDEGPGVALDRFAEDIGTKEAKSLVSVLRTLDENSRDTALEALRGMNNMFARSQIENYRRRRKVVTDISSLPIKVTHFLILFNVLVVIVTMVSYYMNGANANL